jgi:hypothetical protein
MTSKIIKKTLEEANGVPNAELDFSDKQLVSLEPDMTRLWSMKNITRLTLSHNKVQSTQYFTTVEGELQRVGGHLNGV